MINPTRNPDKKFQNQESDPENFQTRNLARRPTLIKSTIQEQFLRSQNLTLVEVELDHVNLPSHLITGHLLYIMALGIVGIAVLLTVCFNPLAVAKLGIEQIDPFDIENQI